MKSADRELFRHALLEVAEANASRYGLPGEAFGLLARRFGFGGIARAEVEAELVYLTDKGLMAEVPRLISPEVRAWRITAAGRDYLAGEMGDR